MLIALFSCFINTPLINVHPIFEHFLSECPVRGGGAERGMNTEKRRRSIGFDQPWADVTSTFLSLSLCVYRCIAGSINTCHCPHRPLPSYARTHGHRAQCSPVYRWV